MKTQFTLDPKIIDALDKLDEVIQEKDLSKHINFIHKMLNGDTFEKIFNSRDDEYIGMAFHCLCTLSAYRKVDQEYRKKIINIINTALTGNNAIAVGKLLADDLRDFSSVNEETGSILEEKGIWWFAEGGMAIADLQEMIQRLAPKSYSMFDWSNPIIIIKDGLKTKKDYYSVKTTNKKEKVKKVPKAGTYDINKQLKEDLLIQFTEGDTYAIENLVPSVEYSYEAFEALADALNVWCETMKSKRENGESIFDINEELSVLKIIIETMIESTKKSTYATDALKDTLKFLNSPNMEDDGETDEGDESHLFRVEAIKKGEWLLQTIS